MYEQGVYCMYDFLTFYFSAKLKCDAITEKGSSKLQKKRKKKTKIAPLIKNKEGKKLYKFRSVNI